MLPDHTMQLGSALREMLREKCSNEEAAWPLLACKYRDPLNQELFCSRDFPGGSDGKESTCKAGDSARQVQTLSQEDPLEKKMATHSSVLPWRIP